MGAGKLFPSHAGKFIVAFFPSVLGLLVVGSDLCIFSVEEKHPILLLAFFKLDSMFLFPSLVFRVVVLMPGCLGQDDCQN